MLLADAVEAPRNAALDDRKEALDRLSVCEAILGDVLAQRVRDRAVLSKSLAD